MTATITPSFNNVAELHQALEAAGCGNGQDARQHTGTQVAHQGDVYLTPVTPEVLAELRKVWTVPVPEHNQVALGSTTGSRHCAEGRNVQVIWPDNREKAAEAIFAHLPDVFCRLGGKNVTDEQRQTLAVPLCGPIVIAPEGFTLTHPEHAHHEFGQGCFFVHYQLDARTLRAVQD